MRWIAFNALGFQAVWWACVLGAGAGAGWAGPLALAAFAALHLRLTPTPARDLRLLAAALLLGLVVDGMLGASGLLAYALDNGPRVLAPMWNLALWAGFALILTHSMAFFARRPLAAAFGLFGGPALAAVGAGWAIALPALYALDRWMAPAHREPRE